MADETERIRRIYERTADHYEKEMAFFEKLLFGEGRQWVCSQGPGDVLELAVSTDNGPAALCAPRF
jgi:hypothetical protein